MLWIKALHLCFVVFWYAGLMYLPRLFVYHCECDTATERARFEKMERRLYLGIMWPAAGLAVATGLLLLWLNTALLVHVWMWLKLVLVAVLLAFHLYCGRCVSAFARTGTAPHSGRFFRVFNEVPALLLIGIVFLVVLQP